MEEEDLNHSASSEDDNPHLNFGRDKGKYNCLECGKRFAQLPRHLVTIHHYDQHSAKHFNGLFKGLSPTDRKQTPLYNCCFEECQVLSGILSRHLKTVHSISLEEQHNNPQLYYRHMQFKSSKSLQDPKKLLEERFAEFHRFTDPCCRTRLG